MKHSYSTQQIIQYIYNELSAIEHLETEYAIEHNPAWREKYLRLTAAKRLLPQVQFFPKGRVLKSVLEYSKATA